MPETEINVQFAVDMKCSSCAEKVTKSLSDLRVNQINIQIPSNSVIISSPEAPSRLLAALRSTGLTTVLRGFSIPFNNANTPYTVATAAVCIFESFKDASKGWAQNINKGLARIAQINDNQIFIDLSVDGLLPNTLYSADIHESGDLTDGSASTGNVYHKIGRFTTSDKGFGELVTEVDGISLWKVIGRSIVLSPTNATDNSDYIAGVIARSAGLFENIKTVCACSGKTLWDETSKL